MSDKLALNPERLMPANPAVREIAMRLYNRIKDLPIISPHGHTASGTLCKQDSEMPSVRRTSAMR